MDAHSSQLGAAALAVFFVNLVQYFVMVQLQYFFNLQQ
jgi:hypothetical protein